MPVAAPAAADPWGEADVSTGKGEKDENFPVGSLLFPRHLRADVSVYYDFARACDDISDSEFLTPEQKIARLDAMQEVLFGTREAPSSRADAQSAVRLREQFRVSHLPLSVATDLLIAFRQDATKLRYQTRDELADYCKNSANPVGRFLLLLHRENAQTLPASDALCTSLQVLNHLQDCAKDLESLDRCYLPQDMMEACGATLEDLRKARSSPALQKVFDQLLDWIDDLNAIALTLPGMVRNRRMRMYCAAVVCLACLLTERLRKGDPVATRVALTRGDFARAALAAFKAW